MSCSVVVAVTVMNTVVFIPLMLVLVTVSSLLPWLSSLLESGSDAAFVAAGAAVVV